MSRIYQGLIPHIKKFAVYMGFNPEVATKNWPSRGTYRVAPGSAPAPTFKANFPLKQDFVGDLQFETREERLGQEAMNVAVKHVNANPRVDARNVWNMLKSNPSRSLTADSWVSPYNQMRFAQVSEKQEATL